MFVLSTSTGREIARDSRFMRLAPGNDFFARGVVTALTGTGRREYAAFFEGLESVLGQLSESRVVEGGWVGSRGLGTGVGTAAGTATVATGGPGGGTGSVTVDGAPAYISPRVSGRLVPSANERATKLLRRSQELELVAESDEEAIGAEVLPEAASEPEEDSERVRA